MMNIQNIPDKNPFKVPDNYFDEVNRKIISLTAGDKSQIRKAGIFIRLRPYIFAAAAVTGFVILSYFAARFIITGKTGTGSEEFYAAGSDERFINYIDIFTLEENAVAIEFPEEPAGIRNSDIIDYLMLENFEMDDIYEIL